MAKASQSTEPADVDRQAQSRDIHIPAPPVRDSVVPQNSSSAIAEQAGIVAVAAGSLDPDGIASTIGPIPFDNQRDRQAEVEREALDSEAKEKKFIADTLENDAKNGRFDQRLDKGNLSTLEAVEDELQEVIKDEAVAQDLVDHLATVADGSVPDVDGGWRPGEVPTTSTNTPEVQATLRREQFKRWVPLIALPAAEAVLIANNWYAFSRGSWLDAIIATGAFLVALAAAPAFAGHVLGRIKARKIITKLDAFWLAVTGVLWLSAGILLSLVRVSTEQDAAVRRAVEEQDRQINQAIEAGAAVPPRLTIDPEQVYSTWEHLPLFVLSLLAIGVAVLFIEAHHNPVLIQHAKALLSLLKLRDRRLILVEYIERVKRSIEEQQKATQTTVDFYIHAREAIQARAESAKEEYRIAAANASPGSELAEAFEFRRTATAEQQNSNPSVP